MASWLRLAKQRARPASRQLVPKAPSSGRTHTHHPKTEVVVTTVGIVTVAAGAPHTDAAVAPSAATQHTGARPFQIIGLPFIAHLCRVVLVVPQPLRPAPLPIVAGQIERAALRASILENAGGRSMPKARLIAIADVRHIRCTAPRKLAPVGMAGGALPLRLARQAQLPEPTGWQRREVCTAPPLDQVAEGTVKEPNHGTRFIPVNAHHGMVRSAEGGVVELLRPSYGMALSALCLQPSPASVGPELPLLISARLDEQIKLGIRQAVPADEESLRDELTRKRRFFVGPFR